MSQGKTVSIFSVTLFMFVNIVLFSQNNNSCKIKKAPSCDNPDENTSFNSGYSEKLYLQFPGIIIYKNGYYLNYGYHGLGENQDAYTDFDVDIKSLLDCSKVILCPTESFFGKKNDSSLTITLRQYIMNGGIVIILAQQYDYEIENIAPVPGKKQGRSL